MVLLRLLGFLHYLCAVILKRVDMKLIRTLFAAAAVTLVFAACGGKKQDKDIITKKPEVKAPAQPVRMQDYDHAETVDWLGARYKLSISRRADTSLPVITDEAGGKYYDNRITVSVVRPDGTQFFSRTFTKADFSSLIGGGYMEKSALLGIVFDKAEGGGLVFAASVGAPDVLSDDYVPLLMTISRMGGVSIVKDTRLDGEMEEQEN